MTYAEIVDQCHELSEQRVKRPNVKRMLLNEVQRLIMRRRYFWRRKVAQWSTVAGTSQYDLSKAGLNVADDLHQWTRLLNATNLGLGTIFYTAPYFYPQAPGLVFLSDATSIARATHDTVNQGPPGAYFMVPGKRKVIQISPIPNGVYPLLGQYYAGFESAADETSETLPDFFPQQFTYVVVACLLKKLFFYLYGQQDERYLVAKSDYEEALADLDAYKTDSTEQALEWRHSDPNVTVTACS